MLKQYEGDWTRVIQDVRVKRLILSEKDRIGIGTFQPKEEKNQDSTELTGDINYRKIAGYDSDAPSFNFDGEFNIAKCGVVEVTEAVKIDVPCVTTLPNEIKVYEKDYNKDIVAGTRLCGYYTDNVKADTQGEKVKNVPLGGLSLSRRRSRGAATAPSRESFATWLIFDQFKVGDAAGRRCPPVVSVFANDLQPKTARRFRASCQVSDKYGWFAGLRATNREAKGVQLTVHPRAYGFLLLVGLVGESREVGLQSWLERSSKLPLELAVEMKEMGVRGLVSSGQPREQFSERVIAGG